ncbi:hypothetical protein CSUB_C1464 [Candidatus Caldarchaeum subterraneum]|uniref:Uncharacterized protein n=1 Tax=Caldiarchaeum subterraneum TaxID=311458 RepID=E6N8C8_CALS0|nr:hypothetical protein HGMM_F04B03C13 [Candidatus Caldarchaeum subterraneum]BAJ49660.1 hypothetical protein HGMM_F21D07C10 [Candidatus Caldarchaeum subterraneum]BAJ51315.1 hypothetical protein CSUB_C1464 [Candidatus Caldarchaeum subterraneum]GBC72535.1 hypothetical protein HRbin03_00365 [archaeon HR03]
MLVKNFSGRYDECCVELERVVDAVRAYLEKRYGEVEFEIVRTFDRGEVYEVAGVFRRKGERMFRRFTFLINSKTLSVEAFGLR